MASSNNYSSIYKIKDMVRNDLMPKFFDMDDINDLNIGMLGLTTELITTTAEDVFNATISHIKETLPTTAKLPETIYNMAALFKVDQLFATPAKIDMDILVSTKDILEKGTTSGNVTTFVLDSKLIVDIKGIQFSPDFDIKITARKIKGEYVYTAMYDYTFLNDLTPSVATPNIKTFIYNEDEGQYLGLIVSLHQMNKYEIPETVVSNSLINNPKFTFKFDNMLANFEVFYRAPGDSKYTQLTKKLKNSPIVDEPFCFYQFKDSSSVEISFSAIPTAFSPEFNSDIIIEYYTTLGDEGNFALFSGSISEITCIASSDTYSYNNNLVLFAVPQTACTGGINTLSFNDLKNIVTEKFATINSITTETDLKLYFNNTQYTTGTQVLFNKKRDDVFERLFTAYALFRDANDVILDTNTLNIEIGDTEVTDDGFYSIPAGTVFSYATNSSSTVNKYASKLSDVSKSDVLGNRSLDTTKELPEFLYVNPFLTKIQKGSNPVPSFYLNSIDQSFMLNYSYINELSRMQFLTSSVSIKRNAIMGEDSFAIKLNIMSTTGDYVNTLGLFDDKGVWQEKMKMKMIIKDSESNEEICIVDVPFKAHDLNTNMTAFEAKLLTDDTITSTGKLKVLNVRDFNNPNGSFVSKIIPFENMNVDFALFYTDTDESGQVVTIPHQYQACEDVKNMTLSNIYSSIDYPLSLMHTFDMIRSVTTYIHAELEDENIRCNLSFVPLFGANDILNTSKYETILQRLNSQIAFLKETKDLLKNNFNIELKFFNTYGKARVVKNEYGYVISKVNSSLALEVFLYEGVDTDSIIETMESYIVDFFDSLDISGDTSIKISKLLTTLQKNIPEINFIKFLQINNYGPSVQILKNYNVDVQTMSKIEIQNFVPEYVTLRKENIKISVMEDI